MGYTNINVTRLGNLCQNILKRLPTADILRDDKSKIEQTCRKLLSLCQLSDENMIMLSSEDSHWLRFLDTKKRRESP